MSEGKQVDIQRVIERLRTSTRICGCCDDAADAIESAVTCLREIAKRNTNMTEWMNSGSARNWLREHGLEEG